jgi:hypothetical protein
MIVCFSYREPENACMYLNIPHSSLYRVNAAIFELCNTAT